MIFLRLLTVLSLISATGAHAGFFIEPTAGYTTGSLSQSDVPAISSQAFLFGGRLGYKLSGLRFGADFSMGFGNGSQFGNSGDYKPTDIGVFVGYDLPFNLNVYGTAFLKSKAKIQSSENPEDFSGRSFRIGLGWTGLRFCTVYVEGTYRTYSKYNDVALTKSIKGMTVGGSVSIQFPGSQEKRSE